MIFDSHAHYDDKAFDPDRDTLLEEMHNSGVSCIVNAATNLESAKFGIEYSHKFDYMKTTVGFHPENIQDAGENYIEELAKLSEDKNVVAVGEIGLDYHYDIPKDQQLRIFEEQLRLAKELDKPVVIHDREAHGDTMQLLRKYKPKGILHCFSGSIEMMKEIMRLGMSISLGGIVTFKNAKNPVNIAREVPIDRLLLETDAPYMTPVPYRGKRCDSRHIYYTAAKIAEIRGIDTQKLLEITKENAEKLFNI